MISKINVLELLLQGCDPRPQFRLGRRDTGEPLIDPAASQAGRHGEGKEGREGNLALGEFYSVINESIC
jgi:hypothetical protein